MFLLHFAFSRVVRLIEKNFNCSHLVAFGLNCCSHLAKYHGLTLTVNWLSHFDSGWAYGYRIFDIWYLPYGTRHCGTVNAIWCLNLTVARSRPSHIDYSISLLNKFKFYFFSLFLSLLRQWQKNDKKNILSNKKKNYIKKNIKKNYIKKLHDNYIKIFLCQPTLVRDEFMTLHILLKVITCIKLNID